MPNHVTHRIFVPAECVSIIKQYFNKDNQFDASLITPMPEILVDTSEGTVSDSAKHIMKHNSAIAIVKNNDIPVHHQIKNNSNSAHILRMTQSEYDEIYKIINAYKETGYHTWYEWCNKHWGTKWGFYNTEIQSTVSIKENELSKGMEFTCQTAWSVPDPLFKTLAECHPELQLVGICFDEGWNFAGAYKIQNGQYGYTDVEPTDEFYEAVYGYEPYREKDDEDE